MGLSFTARVVEVKSGDSYVVRDDSGATETVHLWGAKAPEMSQPYGDAARDAAQELVGGKQVTVIVADRDRQGHVVGQVKTPDGDLGRTLVNEGLAWHYDEEGPSDSVLARLEERARNEERGLWEQDRPTAPWAWRRGPDKMHLAEFVGEGLRYVLVAVLAVASVGGLLLGAPILGVVGLVLTIVLFSVR